MRAWMAALAGGVVISLAVISSASAETLRPTRFDDPKPGACKQRNCSLREAVLKANKNPSPTTIKLRKGRYRLTIDAVGNELQFKTGDLDVLAPLTIVGRGPERSRIMAQGIDRVIDARTQNLKLSLRRLALIGGDAEQTADQPPNAWGGAIQAFEANLTLKNTLVRGNHDGEFGGAIMVYRTTLRILKSRLEGNSSDGRGGAIYSEFSDVTINRSILRNNAADVYGGGLFIPDAQAPPNEATVTASTFVGNSAAVGGGIALDETGIFSADAEPDVQVSNSTFSDNQATVSGGAISAVSGAQLEIDNTTIAYNAADTDNQGGGSGGGLHESTSTVTVGDSIIAMNTVGSTGGGAACNGNYTNGGGNVIAQWSAPCSLPATTLSAQIGQLATNGGPTPTISLLADSPALGAAATCPPADQRGVSRPATGCDSGAFESPLP